MQGWRGFLVSWFLGCWSLAFCFLASWSKSFLVAWFQSFPVSLFVQCFKVSNKHEILYVNCFILEDTDSILANVYLYAFERYCSPIQDFQEFSFQALRKQKDFDLVFKSFKNKSKTDLRVLRRPYSVILKNCFTYFLNFQEKKCLG